MSAFKALIARVAAGQSLSGEDARQAFEAMMSGETTPAQIGAFLMALRVRGETVEELVGAVSTMRAKMVPVEAPRGAVDIVGTGGDASGSLNISTAAAFVIAGAGVPVAKHGNRALSSKSGAADVLAALGVKIEIPPERISACIAEAGIGFMFAPAHHTAMRHVGPARAELGTRTIFNLVGPLSNPAGVKHHMIGVFAADWLEPFARVLDALGSEHAWLVHGSDGLDEITVTGPSAVVELKNGRVARFEVSPEACGLSRHPSEALRGGNSADNAEALRALLGGARGAYRDIVLMNAGAGLVVGGKAATLPEAVALAAESLDGGAAARVLERLVAVSNG